MIGPFSHKDFKKNQSRIKPGQLECAVCGRGIPLEKGKMIRIGGGGSTFVPPNQDDGPADMGFYPIGPECLRKNPELKPLAV